MIDGFPLSNRRIVDMSSRTSKRGASSTLDRLVFICCLAVLVQAQSVFSSEDHHGSTDKHMIGVFLGAEDDARETEFSYGFEYEYRFTEHLGGGLLYERVDDAHHGDGVSVVLGMLSLHPHGGWRFVLGVGREEIDGSHGHNENLVRFGAGYDFHLGKFGIEPTISVDRSAGNSKFIYGILFNRKF
jgi:hypothetical protein